MVQYGQSFSIQQIKWKNIPKTKDTNIVLLSKNENEDHVQQSVPIVEVGE